MKHLFRIIAGIAFLLPAFAAHADAIDGTWCSPSGETITIDGSRITTPGGTVVTGHYSRHSVEFELPEGEKNAGKRLTIRQLHENAVRVSILAKNQQEPPPHEEWRRCQTISSFRPVTSKTRPPA